jgi:hypothetical protein
MVSPTPSGREATATLVHGKRAALRTPPGPLSKAPAVAPLEKVQEALPRRLRGIPVQILLAGTGLVLTCALVGGMVALRNERTIPALEDDGAAPRVAASGSAAVAPRTTARETPSLSASELETARAAGAPALVALAKRFPDDPLVLQALGVAQVRDKDLAGGARTLRHLLEVSPNAGAEREVREALIDVANGPPEVAADAFDLLRTRMGSAGVDLIFDLSQSATGKYAKEHAASALDDQALMKTASRALLVADELRRKAPCQRRASVAKAAAEGDARSIPLLKQMIATRPCGGITALFRGNECAVNTCMTPQDRTSVAAAVAAIEKRDPAGRAVAPAASASASAAAPPGTASAKSGGAGLR